MAKVCWVAKLGVAGARSGGVEQHRDRVVASIRHDQVGLAVAVDVGRRHRGRAGCPWQRSAGWRSWAWSAPGAVVLSSTDTVLSFAFATIRSGLPSPLTSAAVTESGALPVAKVCWAAKLGVAGARGGGVEQHRDRAVDRIRHDQVGLAVAVDVRRRHRVRAAARGEGLLGGEAGRDGPGRGGVEQHRHRVVAAFATIRSGLPSPLTSATVTESGRLPVAKVCWAAKLGVKLLAAPPPPSNSIWKVLSGGLLVLPATVTGIVALVVPAGITSDPLAAV